MKMVKKTGVWASLIAFVWMLLVPNFLFAADAVISKEVGKVSSVEISLGKSRLYKYADPITRISVGDSAIADVMVEGITSALFNKNTKGEIINLGNPEEKTIKDISIMVKNQTQSNSQIVNEPRPVDDPDRRKPDIEKARKILQWE